jgi:hypothetical protein
MIGSVAAKGARFLILSLLLPGMKVSSYNATTTGRVKVNSLVSIAACMALAAPGSSDSIWGQPTFPGSHGRSTRQALYRCWPPNPS